MDMRLYEFKYETVISIDMKLSTLYSNKPSLSHDQTSDDIIKWPPPKSPEKYSRASQFTKHLSSMSLEGDTLLQIQKLWYDILSAFLQYLSTNKSCTAYKSLRVELHNIYSFLLLPDAHPKNFTEKENYESI